MEQMQILRWMFPSIDNYMMRGLVVVTPSGIQQWHAGLGPQPTPAEIEAARPAAEAAEATRIAEAQELTDQKAELRAQFKTAGDRLQQIADAASPTNAQVVQAMRDMATIQRKMLRAMYGILTD